MAFLILSGTAENPNPGTGCGEPQEVSMDLCVFVSRTTVGLSTAKFLVDRLVMGTRVLSDCN